MVTAPAHMTRMNGGRRDQTPDESPRRSRAPNGAIWGLALVINQNLRSFGKGDIIGAKMVDLLWKVYDHSFPQAGIQYEHGETEDAGLLCSFDLAAWATALGWHKPFLSKKYQEALALGFLTCRPALVEKPGDEARLVLRWNHPTNWLPLQEDYQHAARLRHSRRGAGRPPQEADVNSGILQDKVIDFTTRRGQKAGVNSGINQKPGKRYFQDSKPEIPELTHGSHKDASEADQAEPLRTNKKETEEYSVTNVTGSENAAAENFPVEITDVDRERPVSEEQEAPPVCVEIAPPPTTDPIGETAPAILLAHLDQPPTLPLLASWRARQEAQRHLTARLRCGLHQFGVPLRTHRLQGQALREAREEEARLREEYEEERDKLAWMEVVLRTAERNTQLTVEQIEALARAYFEGSLEEPTEEPPAVEEPVQPPWPLLSHGDWHRALVARLFEVFEMDSKEANENERGPIARTAKLLLQSRIRPEAVSNLKEYYESLLARNRRFNEPLPYYSPPAIATAATRWKQACLKIEEEQRRYDQWGEALPVRAPQAELPTEPKRRSRQKVESNGRAEGGNRGRRSKQRQERCP